MKEGEYMAKPLVFDIETTGIEPEYHRITCICAVYGNEEIKLTSYSEKFILWEFILWLEKKSPKLTFFVTHNGKRFDIPFIVTRYKKIFEKDVTSLFNSFNHFDSMEILSTGKWLKLDELAELFGISKKIGNGARAVELFNQGKLQEIEEYCFEDVMITKKVYEIHQKLKGGDTNG